MCAQFMLELPLSELCGRFMAEPFPLTLRKPAERTFPLQQGLVLVKRDGSRRIEAMQFSLLPSWSRERKLKFATYNARMESVDSKATWKVPFQRRRCLVPLNGFAEASRHGEHAGYMLRLVAKQPLMLAAGVYDSWRGSKTGEHIDSFAILTEQASPAILAIGHDRCPVFVREDAADGWLDEAPRDPDYLKAVLASAKAQFDFDVERDRALKGVEKDPSDPGLKTLPLL